MGQLAGLAATAAGVATGPFGIALMAIGTGLSVFSQMQQASAAEEQGRAQQEIYNMQARNTQAVAERNALIRADEAKYAATRKKEQAVQEEAVGLKRAKETRRQTALRLSSAAATAAASGAGGNDPTVAGLFDDLIETGELNARTELYEGQSAASMLRSDAGLTEYMGERDAEMIRYGGQSESSLMRYQGGVAGYEGKATAQAKRTAAAGSLFEGMSNIATKYKPKMETINWNQGGSSSWYN